MLVFLLNSCQDDEADFGTVIAPTNLRVEATIADDRSGNVTVAPTAENVVNFHVFFQPNSDPVVITPDQTASFRYTQPGEFTAIVTVVAFGIGGISSSVNIELELDVEATIDPVTLANIAGTGSKRWVWNQSEPEHFGVGDPSLFVPNFFAATPNSLNPCLYDDVLIFSFDTDGNLSYELETNGETFINWAEVNSFFPDAVVQQFVDECRAIDDQISTSTSFSVLPGENGTNAILNVPGSLLSYGNGALQYEITELSEDRLVVRSIQSPFLGGGDLAWYFVFVPEESNSGGGEDSTFDELIWSDEFDVNGAPDTASWTFETGTGNNGWGNSEEQFYTDRSDNINIEDGILKITARRESFSGSQFTSSRIKTQDKFEFQYGKIEARIKLPTGVGTWPAFWMLGADFETNIWPAAGEIDIMEHVGAQQDRIFGTTHDPNNFGGNGRTNSTVIQGASDEFHVYTVEWTASEIRWFVDGQMFHEVTNNGSLPFNKDFFILLNVAMGGTFGGPIDAGFVESTLEVDYVRVYQ